MNNDSIVAPQQEQAVIYLQDGAEVYGLSNNSNAIITKTKSPDFIVKQTKKKERRTTTVAMKIAEKENEEKRDLKELQDKINHKISHFYYTDSDSNTLLSAQMLNLNNEATNVLGSSQNLKGIVAARELIVISFKLQLAKQKFYTSLSYLQFGKLRNSFLRGPPTV